ncbi:MAG: efflux RND transporter permease subunit [Planctomycetota bacterium]
MIHRIVGWCLERPVSTSMLHFSLIVLGALALTRLPLNSLPASERPQVNVEIDYPNATPEQVEREVTRPVESILATLRGVKSIESESEQGSARVTLDFAWGTQLDQVKLEVRERLARIRHELPIDDLERIRIRGAFMSGNAIIKGRISARGIDLSKNYELLINRVRRPLERIEGVSQVEIDGVTPLEIQVTFRQEELERFGLTLDGIARRLEEHNTQLTVGELVEDRRLLRARVIAGFSGLDDVRAFPVHATGVRLDQVADVRLAAGELREGRHLNGSYAVPIEVYKESDANTVETSAQVKREIARMSEDPELAGVDLLIWEDQGQMILDSLHGLQQSGSVGSLLALGILWLFLRRASATLLVGLAIPLSLLSAFAVLYVLGRDLNVITMVALMLGVGMLVDNSVIVVEAILRLRAGGLGPHAAARQATLEMATPIFASTLSSVIVFLPVAFGEPSQMNDYLREVGVVISVTLASSLFVALTLIPMAAARFSAKQSGALAAQFVRPRRVFGRAQAAALRHPWVTLSFTFCVLASAVLPLKWGFVFNLEDSREVTRNVSLFYTPIASLDYSSMELHVAEVERAITAQQEQLDIRDIYSWYRDNFAWTAVYPRKTDLDEAGLALLRAKLDALVPKLPGVSVRTGDWGMFWGRGGGSDRSAGAVRVRVFGDSIDRIQGLITQLRPRFEACEGVTGTEVEYRDAADQVTVRPEPQKLTHLGVSARQFARHVSAFFSESRVREIRAATGEIQIKLRMAGEQRNSLRELSALEISTSAGTGALALSELSQVEIADAPGELRRENRQSSGTVSVKIAPERLSDGSRIVEEVLSRFEWPRGYSYEIGAGYRQRQENNQQYGVLFGLAVFLVYIVMACLFESLLHPLLIMTTVVMALPGVIWGLYLQGDRFDQPAAIGLVLLAGIVVNNGIVLIDHVRRLLADGVSLADAVLVGTGERLRPVLITSLATIIALLPMAYGDTALFKAVPFLGGRAEAAGIAYSSLARTIVSGLAVSTVLTLFALPIIYYVVESARAKLRGLRRSA